MLTVPIFPTQNISKYLLVFKIKDTNTRHCRQVAQETHETLYTVSGLQRISRQVQLLTGWHQRPTTRSVSLLSCQWHGTNHDKSMHEWPCMTMWMSEWFPCRRSTLIFRRASGIGMVFFFFFPSDFSCAMATQHSLIQSFNPPCMSFSSGFQLRKRGFYQCPQQFVASHSLSEWCL